jgi:hypothetical protein
MATDREPGDGGRRFVASEPVEEGGADSQSERIVVVLPASWMLRIARVECSNADAMSPCSASRRAWTPVRV